MEDAAQATAIFGDASPDAIAAALLRAVEEELGARVRGCLYEQLSIGATFELELSTGASCVVKALRPSDKLRATLAVQAALATDGIPAPAILFGPLRCGPAEIHGMEARDRGEGTTYTPALRKAMATTFAELIERGRRLPIEQCLISPPAPGRKLWGRPHSALFDFEATVAGAEQIDMTAARARSVLGRSNLPPVLAHGDWSRQNLAFRDGAVVSIFDWDSVAGVSEPLAVAHAAAFHSHDWREETPDPKVFYLDLEATMAFVDDYSEAAGRTWSNADRDTMHAGLVYRLAYQARCEHAYRPNVEGPAKARLMTIAAELGYD